MERNSTLTPSGDFARIARAIEFMSRNVAVQPSLRRVAQSAGMSEYHFARMFRRWAGISPKQFIQKVSLEVAKTSLRDDASVLQAALDTGLSGPGRLHDLFVTLEAVTPGEYKGRGRGLTLRHGSADSPFGRAVIAMTQRGVAYLGFADGAHDPEGWSEFQRAWPEANWVEDDAAAREVARTIWGVASPGRRIRLWVHGSNFQMQVWQALLRRASDSIVSYGDIAQEIGRRAASRAVGTAVGANPVAWLIPCHHVLRANGALGGYRWGIERKRAMLAWELSQSIAAAP